MGSGNHWKRHIKKHGKEYVETLWYCLFYDKEDCTRFALAFSVQQDIVESELWANQITENGLDERTGTTHSLKTRQLFSKHRLEYYKHNDHPRGMLNKQHSPETKKQYSETRSGEDNGMFNRNHSDETKQHWSDTRRGKNCGKENPNYGNHVSEELKLASSRRNKNMVSAFDKIEKKNVQISKDEFEQYKTIRYVGIASKEAKVWRRKVYVLDSTKKKAEEIVTKKRGR